MLRMATVVVMMALGVTALAASSARPHIALIVSDDLGWDDVGFRRVIICMPWQLWLAVPICIALLYHVAMYPDLDQSDFQYCSIV